MVTMEEKISALTELMKNGILTADEFSKVVATLNGKEETVQKVEPPKEKSPLAKQYDEVFARYVINVFKSPSACKWPELTSDMVIKGSFKIDGKMTECTYIETYIDAPNSYGAVLRQKLRFLMDENGIITRALTEMKTSGVTLLGMLANAALKDNWTDICKF